MNDEHANDPIVEEVRRAGGEYMRQFNGDMDAAMDDLRRLTRESGKRVLSLPPKRIPADARDSGKQLSAR